MVFEYVDYDLTGLMDSPGVVLSELHIKTYMLQLLTGTMVMHKNHIIHRDLKGKLYQDCVAIARPSTQRLTIHGLALRAEPADHEGRLPEDRRLGLGAVLLHERGPIHQPSDHPLVSAARAVAGC